MKFTVSMKDPDTLSDAIDDAVQLELETTDLPQEEKDMIAESRIKKVYSQCSKWFRYGEYLEVQIDTDAETCTVIPQE